MNIDVESIFREVGERFPSFDMPDADQLQYHSTACDICSRLASDLEAFRGKSVGVELIREIHQEMAHLSPAAWRWLLPYYLRYCLTPEAEYTRFETEFLIYALGPTPEFEEDVLERLALFSAAQLIVLHKFLSYLASVEYWSDYCPVELIRAIHFISSVIKDRAKSE